MKPFRSYWPAPRALITVVCVAASVASAGIGVATAKAPPAKATRVSAAQAAGQNARNGTPLDAWWIKLLPEKGGEDLMDFSAPGKPAIPKTAFPMNSEQRNCLASTISPAISEWKRKQILRNPTVGASEAEMVVVADAIDRCGLTLAAIAFNSADSYQIFLPSTVACMNDSWRANPKLARSYLGSEVLYTGESGDRAATADLMRKCITPTDVAAVKAKIADSLNKINASLK